MRSAGQPGLGEGRLEQLDWVAARILDQDLLAADAGDDVVAEAGAVLAQIGDDRVDVGDLELKAIPSAGRRHRAVGHGLTTTGPAARGAENEPEVAAREHREAWAPGA